MITDREQEILFMVKSNPMVSQQEIADKLGITRSSVAVHISNLMKKGHIHGKGYILNENPYVVAIGGLTRDIGGKPYNNLVMEDSNPGMVRTTLGGVARNIAHNMGLLGISSKILTAVGDDELGQHIETHNSNKYMDLSHIRKVPGEVTATYLYVADKKGDMVAAIADMSVLDYVTPEYIYSKAHILNNAEAIVLDTNIPEATIKQICDIYNGPIFLDPISTEKGQKVKDMIGRVHTLKPNKMEAEMLSGVTITDDDSLSKAADVLLGTGLERVFISLGADGVFACDHRNKIHVPALPANLVNATGGGDAFVGALVYSYLHGYDLEKSAVLGQAASAMAIESADTINENITIDKVIERAKIEH